MAEGGGFGGRTGLYTVGISRNEGITGQIEQAYTLNDSDYRGLNRNQRQNAVFVNMTIGEPKITQTCRCLTANYAKSGMSHRKGELSGVMEQEAA